MRLCALGWTRSRRPEREGTDTRRPLARGVTGGVIGGRVWPLCRSVALAQVPAEAAVFTFRKVSPEKLTDPKLHVITIIDPRRAPLQAPPGKRNKTATGIKEN